MKYKVILVDNIGNETEASKHKALNEAFQFASLMQSMVNNENFTYRVIFKLKGIEKRVMADNFTSVVSNSTHLYNLLKPIFC
jgi:thiaminase